MFGIIGKLFVSRCLLRSFKGAERKLAEKSELKDGVLEPLQGSLLRRFGSDLAVRCRVCEVIMNPVTHPHTTHPRTCR